MVNNMSGFLFHSVSRVSIFRSSSTVGSGIEMLGRGWVLGLPSRSPSSCSDDPVPASDSLSRDNSKSENIFIRIYITSYYKIHLETIFGQQKYFLVQIKIIKKYFPKPNMASKVLHYSKNYNENICLAGVHAQICNPIYSGDLGRRNLNSRPVWQFRNAVSQNKMRRAAGLAQP